ncbi:TlpA disulfide reductase family protein [Prevotella sp. 10(H)]|uniref:TlpA family protein disulfide reductase n=1 Tax=Prevotella sp. 10(H) TaxID=1158294 RepID=UPI0004A6C5C6|nr:TlpA disulfide reductase family protein [Prevotella sp. 10(H)]
MKPLVKIFLLSFLIFLIISPLRGGYIEIGEITGFLLSSIVGFVVYYSFTYYITYKYNEKIKPAKILGAILLGVSIVTVPMHAADFEPRLISLPEYFIHLLGILLGFSCFYIKKIYFKITLTVLSLLVAAWLSIPGYEMWLHKINFHTFTGKVTDDTDYNLTFNNTDSDTLSIKDFRGRYLLLDCWHSFCGVCYQELPYVQETYDKYKDNSLIKIYSLHCRMEDRDESVQTGARILSENGYSLPALSIDIENSVLKEGIGVEVFPTVLIFDKESKLIYKGNIERAAKLIDDMVDE